ncbi:hypothetical protein [Metasolibacillus meyeri]|uniref:hypothetical protein n=1 Tax=Metasolibacillus meyeri TaxID=1071052 RepID=UPI000D2FCA72|nr:hypothetical protein [Metasolibacillus meyeri]
MNNVQQKPIYFRPDISEKISLIVAENNLACEEEAIEFLVESYFERRLDEPQTLLGDLDGILQQRLLEAVIHDLKHLRMTVNAINSDTKMLLEFWNHYFIMSDEELLQSTEELVSAPFQKAERLVRERMAHNRQKKLDDAIKRMTDDSYL